MWIGASCLWKFTEYLLETRGYNMFFELWILSIGFFGLNSYVIVEMIKNQPVREFKI